VHRHDVGLRSNGRNDGHSARLPGSDLDLPGNVECVIDLDAEEPEDALYLGERVGPGATAPAGWSS
jgi:hypothetical protein